MSVAHLADQQRMFFVTLLLNRVAVDALAVGHVEPARYASGTRSRVFAACRHAAVEAAAAPLLKPARAFGLGVVLATQNPIDIDYEGLSNAGTWFLGRLQTERDKARVSTGSRARAG